MSAVALQFVTPCAGVWIEITLNPFTEQSAIVTPCAGVWIEMYKYIALFFADCSHSLCGSVD